MGDRFTYMCSKCFVLFGDLSRESMPHPKDPFESIDIDLDTFKCPVCHEKGTVERWVQIY